MKLNQRTIKNYKPYYYGIGAFALVAGLALGRPFMWFIGLAFLIYAALGKGKKSNNE